MNNAEPIEYALFEGAYMAHVEYDKNLVVVYERGGWSRRYDMSFAQLAKKAASWKLTFDTTAPEADVAELGARIILATENISHGLSPDQFVKIPTALSTADKKAIKAFEHLLDKHGMYVVAQNMREDTLEKLREMDDE